MTDRIIAVNSNCYHGYSIEEAIAGIRAAGFHYIELIIYILYKFLFLFCRNRKPFFSKGQIICLSTYLR